MKLRNLFRAKHVDTFPDVLRKKFERITPAPPAPPKEPKVIYQVRGFSREFIDVVHWIQWKEYLCCHIHFRLEKNGVKRFYKQFGKETDAEQRWWKRQPSDAPGGAAGTFPLARRATHVLYDAHTVTLCTGFTHRRRNGSGMAAEPRRTDVLAPTGTGTGTPHRP